MNDPADLILNGTFTVAAMYMTKKRLGLSMQSITAVHLRL